MRQSEWPFKRAWVMCTRDGRPQACKMDGNSVHVHPLVCSSPDMSPGMLVPSCVACLHAGRCGWRSRRADRRRVRVSACARRAAATGSHNTARIRDRKMAQAALREAAPPHAWQRHAARRASSWRGFPERPGCSTAFRRSREMRMHVLAFGTGRPPRVAVRARRPSTAVFRVHFGYFRLIFGYVSVTYLARSPKTVGGGSIY